MPNCRTCGKVFTKPPKVAASQFAHHVSCSEACRRSYPAEKRFWSYVDVTGKDCWGWKACHAGNKSHRYGSFSLSKKVRLPASRACWMFVYGPIPDGMFVCHKCDNPGCVRPSHLFLGTPLDNTRDSIAKGRDYRGERHKWAKLTEKQVGAIRDQLAAGASQASLAREYGVVPGHIYNISAGLCWKRVSTEGK